MNQGLDKQDGLWACQLVVARGGAAYLIGYVLVVATMYSTADILYPQSNALYLTTALIGWILGYVLLALLMRTGSKEREAMPGGIAGYFGMSVLTSIAISVGLVLLVLPGLYLMMRWLPAFARLYSSGGGVVEALGWSWRQTVPIQKALGLAMIPALAPYVVIIVLGLSSEEAYASGRFALYDLLFVGINICISISVAWLQLLGVAAYRLIEREPEELVETFS
ncbi:MAG: hypothetical protein AAF697_05835 [Pseudomonadota bacterium]